MKAHNRKGCHATSEEFGFSDKETALPKEVMR